MPFEQASFSFPAVSESFSDSHSQPGVNVSAEQVCVKSSPESPWIWFGDQLLGKDVEVGPVVKSVPFGAYLLVHESGSDVIKGQSADGADDRRQKHSSGFHKIKLAESNEKGFMKVVIWTSQGGVQHDMSHDVRKRSFISRVLSLESGQTSLDAGVVSPPFFVDLGVENLSDRNQSEGSGEVGSGTTSYSTDNSFLS